MTRATAILAALALMSTTGCENKAAEVGKTETKKEVKAGPKAQLPQPTTQDELLKDVVDAIRRDDLDNLIYLMPSNEELKKMCPMSTPRDPEKTRARMKSRLAQCRSYGDWSKAEVFLTEGGEQRVPMRGCSQVMRHRDIDATMKIGEKKFTLKIDDPFVLSGKEHFLGDFPKCKELKEE